MSRLVLDPVRMTRKGVYETHQALWDVYSDRPDRKRDFLYREIAPHTFLVVSPRRPVDTSFLHRHEVKEYAPQLKAGERILFSLRFNPVVKRRDAQGRQQRIDLVQDKRLRLIADGVAKTKLPRRTELAEEAALQWLERRRDALGLEVDPQSVMVESYGQDRFRKTGGASVTLARADVRGFASVSNPDVLRTALFNGVGCAKGFGFGLMLVRRS